MGLNFLLNTGPMGTGDLEPLAYENMAKLSAWMKVNGESIHGTRALQGKETASVPATTKGDVRYLYLLPVIKGENPPAPAQVSMTGLDGTYQAQLLDDGKMLPVTRDGDTLVVARPEGVVANTVRVIKLSPVGK